MNEQMTTVSVEHPPALPGSANEQVMRIQETEAKNLEYVS